MRIIAPARMPVVLVYTCLIHRRFQGRVQVPEE
jgi:hypothetical protein